ncbi:Crp/Fnr family transcriptional regulator [Pseudoalteromonas sp. JBTF-M23]|uniref:Crp/Fnr family transcriptional regulator n=1 Tax=Pseudoalteromonas caenipelagi TaxID=2726988 RepID=A0A849V9M9_9GAMM|nr:Crp/Fnr family transcriptional regulator [Pseudoalteromonas caenipelagi]
MYLDDFLKQYGSSVNLKKGEHAFYQGDSNSSLYFVVAGLLKAYYISLDGKESIKSFIKPKNIIGSLSVLQDNGVCSFNLVALEQTQLIRLPLYMLIEASSQFHSLSQQLVNILIELSMKKEQREYDFLTLSAEDRLLKFRNAEPELYEKLTQIDVAKHIGITPVALSRIKRRLQI